jgi:hypothetical protein
LLAVHGNIRPACYELLIDNVAAQPDARRNHKPFSSMSDNTQSDADWKPRFGLKGIFALLTIAAIVLAPTYWCGAVYLVSAAFSVFLVAACAVTYKSRRTTALVFFAAGGVFAGFVLLLGFIVFFFHAVINAVACIPLAALKVAPRTFALVLVGIMVAIYGFAFSQGVAALRKTSELRQRYPLVSLEKRLAYERRPESNKEQTADPQQLSHAVATNLDRQDQTQQAGYFSRSGALHELHAAAYSAFANAAGFGNMRMETVNTRLTKLGPIPEFVLPTPVALSVSITSDKEFLEVHDTAVNNFISQERMGYVKNRSQVAGFESHRLASLNERWQCACQTTRNWQVTRLELVGLLRDDDPRVYTSKTIPRMEQLADSPHRELNEFEKSALPKLATQKDVIVNQQSNRIQMLGALRAGQTCLKCHEGDRGKLLGAFSYEIVPYQVAETTGAAKNSAD